MYIDDGLIMSSGLRKATQDSAFVRGSLESAGLVINTAKSHWEPNQSRQWLGYVLNIDLGFIAIPEYKVEMLKQCLIQAVEAQVLPARFLASIVGRVISMGLALGPIARLRTRSMYCLLNSRTLWVDRLIINDEVKEELYFWRSCVDEFNGQKLWKSASAVRVVYSDASGTGYAGYTVEHGCHVAHGQWMECEKGKSSTWRELAAVARVLEAVSGLLCNCSLSEVVQ